MNIALLQINPTAGDLRGNAALLSTAAQAAAARGADLAVSPELALAGYPPHDLLLSADFVTRSWTQIDLLARELADGPPTLIGLPELHPSNDGRPLFNTVALIRGGRIEQRIRSARIPADTALDESRYFEPFHGTQTIDIAGRRVGISFCADRWNDRNPHDPIEALARDKAQVIVALAASPFACGKHALREQRLADLARRHQVPLVYVNQFGGNDDLVFDGRSCGFSAAGAPIARGASFDADVVLCDITRTEPIGAPTDLDAESELWSALVLGTRDYARKCGFGSAVLGLSGGIDSALVAAIAVEALGPSHVLGVMMPSPYSSRGSVDDSAALAATLGIDTLTLPIEDAMTAMDRTLAAAFAGTARDVTEENLQARIRGTLLMALSNKRGSLLLTTGNKSELAVGYCTLYGDMAGGLAVIADVPKTMVYRVARWVNATRGTLIPESILTKAPSAELRPNQTDQDSLPPYDLLDDILQRHIERHESADTIVAAGFDPHTVHRVLRLVRHAEFKRKQAAPGLQVTTRAFGAGWRMPIAAKYEP
ncbi:MAG: NAD+ synthase [Acidobacteriaceae bacterium]|nr:NAD+ synthase [Acidobacteriaceae bacterium]